MDPNENENTLMLVYDNVVNSWVYKRLYEIPRTYTFAPYPEDVYMELDYFVRSAGLVNHRFVWSSNQHGIPFDLYMGIRSNINKEMRGRYTQCKGLPKIGGLMHKTMDEVVMSQEDIRFIIGSLDNLPLTIHGTHFQFIDD